MRKIYIYQGDENRAKIEEGLNEDIFFAEVYKKAEEILRELIDESKEYKRIAEKVDCENTQYQRMGNNIIAFCASRGQGKTSAMKSFAKYLSNGYGDNNQILDQNIPQENAFVVLDSVDPAALDSGESLVRVVISRIFYLLEKKCEENHNYFKNNQEKNRLLELFQECYGSIDYLRGKKQRDDSQDDLERLAALGNSARLKMNLIKLIDLFLKIYTENGSRLGDRDQRSRYLVVPIDDVDICTADIYGCCEEIRNYLALPNVIVLLAADYLQLHRVILQKYLQINKGVVEYESGFKKECNRQASGYLLKLLPNNHVIELPEYDSIAEKEWKELRLVYYKKSWNNTGERLVDVFSEELKVCKNLQEQIIKIIYDRTGIILWDDEEKFLKFIPQTMRELTQLIKKLTQGSKIDHQMLYLLDAEGNPVPNEREVSALLNNIRLYKSFFLDNWCVNNMTPMQIINLKEWIHTLEKKKRSGAFNYKLDDMLAGRVQIQESNSNEADNYVPGDEMPPQGISAEYIAMCLTIFLNEWFAEALLDKEQYKKIVAYIDGENGLLQVSAKYDPEIWYNVFYFQIPDKFLNMVKSLSNFFTYFCREEKDKQYFDFFNPWRYILQNGFDGKASPIDKGESETSETINNAEGMEMESSLDMRLPLKTMISNCGIYRHIKKKIVEEIQEDNDKPNWRRIVAVLFGKDTWSDHLEFLRIVPSNLEMISEYYFSVERSWYLAFSMNSQFLQRYVNQYMDNNSRILGDEDIKDEDLASVLSDWENNNSNIVAAIIKSSSAEEFADNDSIKSLILAQQVISSRQKEIDELLSQKIRTESDIEKARKLIADIREEYRKAIGEETGNKEKDSSTRKNSGKKTGRKTTHKETVTQSEGFAEEEAASMAEADIGRTDTEQTNTEQTNIEVTITEQANIESPNAEPTNIEPINAEPMNIEHTDTEQTDTE